MLFDHLLRTRRAGELAVFFCALLSLVALAPRAARADNSSVTVSIGGKPVPFTVGPYVGPDGEVYAPAEIVRLLGATFVPDGGGRVIAVTGANGRKGILPAVMVGGHSCISMQKLGYIIGATVDYRPGDDKLNLRARLEMVRQDARGLSIYTSFPVATTVRALSRPDRIYVDLSGLDLAGAPASVPVMDSGRGDVLRIRSGQIDPEKVRITIDLRQAADYRVTSDATTDQVHVAMAAGDYSAARRGGTENVADADAEQSSPPARISLPPARVVQPPTAPSMPGSAQASTVVTQVYLQTLPSGITRLTIATKGPSAYRTERLDNPERIAFDVVGAQIGGGVRDSIPGDGANVKSVRSGTMHAGEAQYGRVVIDLDRMTGFAVTRQEQPSGGVVYEVNLMSPGADEPSDQQHVAEGDLPPLPVQPMPPSTSPFGSTLHGKVICIDPGHGADDTGALGPDGSREKDITLAIGKRLREVLTAEGATVLMTRTEDVKPSVMARPLFANSHGASLFISIHCDSCDPLNSHSGTTVYFHAQNQICRRMAQDVIQRVSQVSGIPSDGVKSDTIRFQSGFGVLRGSAMPAVLVECGYMNNTSDLAKLKTDETQQNIAEGIAAGLKDFIGDRSARR